MCPSAHCLSSFHLDYFFFSFLSFFSFFKSETPEGKKKNTPWALILYLSTVATMSGCPRRTRGFISNLQSDTGEGPSNLHTWWDTCMSSASRGASPTARPHTVTQPATVFVRCFNFEQKQVQLRASEHTTKAWILLSCASMSAKARYDSYSKAAGRKRCWE